MAPTKVVEEEASEVASFGENIDQTAFDQILEMDDDSERDFSKGIVYGFFEQAETTFSKMEDAIKESNLQELSQLGHFLKGSSATLGLKKVRDACEKIQNFGAGKNENGTEKLEEKRSLENIKQTLKEVKGDYKEVAIQLKKFYGEKIDTEEKGGKADKADSVEKGEKQK